jgi:hypothetical protein
MAIRGKVSQKSRLAPTASLTAANNVSFLKILPLSHLLELSVDQIPASYGILSANLGDMGQLSKAGRYGIFPKNKKSKEWKNLFQEERGLIA